MSGLADFFAQHDGDHGTVDPLTGGLRDAAEEAGDRAADSLDQMRHTIGARYGLNRDAIELLTGWTQAQVTAHAERLAQDRSNLARYSPSSGTAEAFAEHIEAQLSRKQNTWIV